jgi:mRNA interferase MazF
VVTTNIANQYRRTAVIIPLSSSPGSGPPIRVPLTCQGRAAVAVVDQIRAVTKERFLNKIENITGQQLRSVEDALRNILEL